MHCESGPNLMTAASIKGHGRMELLLLAGLSSLSLASSFVLNLTHFFTDTKNHFFGIPTYIENWQLSRTSLELQNQITTAETLILMD